MVGKNIEEEIKFLEHQIVRNWRDYEDCQDTTDRIVRKIDELEEKIEALKND